MDEPTAHAPQGAPECECGCGQPVRMPLPGHGHPVPRFVRGHQYSSFPKAAEHYLWKGSGAGYQALHAHLRKYYPKTRVCDECGKSHPGTQFALIHGREYSRNREDYRELCPRCHVRYDRLGVSRTPESIERERTGMRLVWKRERERGIERAFPRGESAHNAKLAEAQVIEIRRRRKARESSLALGREFGVDKKTILSIEHRRSWAHVPDPDEAKPGEQVSLF